MEHLSNEIIDLYLLNQSLLGEKLESVKRHLSICDECKITLKQFENFYEKVQDVDDIKNPKEKINFALQRHTFPEFHSLDEIFKHKKKRNFMEFLGQKIVIPLYYKIDSLLESFFTIFRIHSPGIRWALAGAIPVIIVVTLYIYLQFYVPVNKNNITADKDSLKQKEYLSFKSDSLNVNFDTTKTVKQEENEIKKQEEKTKSKANGIGKKFMFAFLPNVSIAYSRGGEEENNYDIYPVYNKYYKSVAVIVFEKGTVDISKPEKDVIKYLKLKKEKHYIIFPKTVLNEDFESKNYIGSKNIEFNSKEGLEVKISDKKPRFNLDDEFVKYKFDNNFKINSVEFNSNFSDKYDRFLKEKKIDSIPKDVYKNILIEKVKDLK